MTENGKSISEINWKQYGEYMAECRRAAKVSQTAAARASGMSRTQWSRIELGESGTRIGNIEGMAHAVNASVSKAYELAGYISPANAGIELSMFSRAPFSRLNDLPAHRRQILLQQIEALIEIELRSIEVPPTVVELRSRAKSR